MKTLIWKHLIVGAGILLLATTAAMAEEITTTTIRNQPTGPTEAVGSMTAQHFVSDAIWGNDKEIALGRLAQEKSQNPDVKAFASRMIADHSRAVQTLTTIADC